MPNQDIQTLQAAVAIRKSLYSIFDRVEIAKHQPNLKIRSSLPKSRLTADGLANGFPPLLPDDLKDDLDKLLYLREAAHADTLPYLFQKYGWRIAKPDADPNNPEKQPDAAFCDTFRAERALDKPGIDGYLLVKGDLTGIQEYIYNGIQPKETGNLSKLSKRLRARSILVSLLTDFIATVILRELGLSSWHLLFAGGGHFNLLLPNEEETRVRLKMTAESLDKSIKERFGENLELIIAQVEVKDKADITDHTSRCFEEVNMQRDRKKYTQHRKDLYDLFEHKVKEDKAAREDREQRIGGAFPKQHYLIEVCSADKLRYHDGDLILAEFEPQPSHYYTLLGVADFKKAKSLLDRQKDIQSVHILALNDTDFLPNEDWKSSFHFPVSFGFRFLGKNAPTKINEAGEVEIMDFEDLANIGQEDRKKGEGFLRLGALMLDVDNLGLIFSHGLPGATLPHIITLSREMNYFFTAHFNQRAEEHQVYVVYSGGDDAFAVGKWDMLIRFAKVLRADFQKFICYEENLNSDVHFSAGIFMSNPFYPIGRFYRDVKALQEEKAKKADGKNSVDVFDHTLSWGSFDGKIDLGDQLYEPLDKGVTASGRKFSASFAYRIMQLVKNSYYERDTWEGGQFHRRGHLRMGVFARNVANMRYLFARNGFADADIQKLTDKLEKELTQSFLKDAFNFEAKYDARDYLVALNFAMLQLRSKTKSPATHG